MARRPTPRAVGVIGVGGEPERVAGTEPLARTVGSDLGTPPGMTTTSSTPGRCGGLRRVAPGGSSIAKSSLRRARPSV